MAAPRKDWAKSRALVESRKQTNGPTKMPSGLSHKQENFARVFARTGSTATAYAEAGYADQGSPEKNAQACYRVACNPRVQKRVDEYREKFATALNITDLRLLQELACLAMADPSKLFEPHLDENGAPISIAPGDLPEEIRRAIQEIRVVKGKDGRAEIHYRLCDKIKALELLGAIKGVLRSQKGVAARVEIKTSDGGIVRVETAVR